MDDVQRLLAVEEIKKLKATYFRTLDSKDWEGYGACFTEDVIFDFRQADMPGLLTMAEAEPLLEGPAAAVRWVQETTPGPSVHHGHMPEIEVTSETTATGVWSLADHNIYPEGQGHPFRELKGYGYYHDTYRRDEGVWRIAEIRLTRLHQNAEVVHVG